MTVLLQIKLFPCFNQRSLSYPKLSDFVTETVITHLILGVRTLQWRHNEHSAGSNFRHLECLFNHLFGGRSKKSSKLHDITGLCERNSRGTSEIPVQRASDAEDISIWWLHHESWKKGQTSKLDAAEICHKVFIYINGLVQERCNSSPIAMELHLSCTKPVFKLNHPSTHPRRVKSYFDR